jgi:hypothetical protein
MDEASGIGLVADAGALRIGAELRNHLAEHPTSFAFIGTPSGFPLESPFTFTGISTMRCDLGRIQGISVEVVSKNRHYSHQIKGPEVPLSQ